MLLTDLMLFVYELLQVIFLGGFFPYFALSPPEYSLETKTAASLLSPTAFGFALDIMASYENSGVGATPDNLTVLERNFFMSRALGMMLLDTILYFILGWYIDNTLPSRLREFGVARPWYFPVTSAYWREVLNLEPTSSIKSSSGAAAREVVSLLPNESPVSTPVPNATPSATAPSSAAKPAAAAGRVHNGPPTPSTHLEPLDASLRAKEREGRAVVLAGLRKEFSTPDGIKVAVDDVSLTMVEGQVTCLLGHNGEDATQILVLVQQLSILRYYFTSYPSGHLCNLLINTLRIPCFRCRRRQEHHHQHADRPAASHRRRHDRVWA